MLRPGRRPRGGVVAVTGARSGAGRALVERLAAGAYADRLVALDGTADAAALDGVQTVVHLDTSADVALPAAPRREHTVTGTAAVLEAAREAGVRAAVLVTSADVYGARPGNPVPLPDDWPLAAGGGDATLLSDHVEVERLAEHAARTGLLVTVLRPATVVGGPLGAAYDGQLLRQLAGPRLLALRGVEPLWQVCHSDDLLAALELVATGGVPARPGVTGLGVASEGALPQAQVERLARRSRLELPAAVALSTAERLHRLGLTASSPRELDHLLAPLVLAADGLRAAGWEASWSNEAALLVHLAARDDDRAGRTTGAAGAAGATAALLGTAALVRARRSRGRR